MSRERWHANHGRRGGQPYETEMASSHWSPEYRSRSHPRSEYRSRSRSRSRRRSRSRHGSSNRSSSRRRSRSRHGSSNRSSSRRSSRSRHSSRSRRSNSVEASSAEANRIRSDEDDESAVSDNRTEKESSDMDISSDEDDECDQSNTGASLYESSSDMDISSDEDDECEQINAGASIYESAANSVLVPYSSSSPDASLEFSGLSSPPSSSRDESSRPSYSPHAEEDKSSVAPSTSCIPSPTHETSFTQPSSLPAEASIVTFSPETASSSSNNRKRKTVSEETASEQQHDPKRRRVGLLANISSQIKAEKKREEDRLVIRTALHIPKELIEKQTQMKMADVGASTLRDAPRPRSLPLPLEDTKRSASKLPPSTDSDALVAFIQTQTWMNGRNCPNDDCDDEACPLSQHDEEMHRQFTSIASRTELDVDVSESTYFVDKIVRISGCLNGTTKEQLADQIRKAGAVKVTTRNGSLGDADVLVAGTNCGVSLRTKAEESGIDVLTQSQAIRYLRGTKTSDSDTTLPGESDENLFPFYCEKAKFDSCCDAHYERHLCVIEDCYTWSQRSSTMCVKHSSKFNDVAPPGISRQVTIWESSLDYQYGSFEFVDDNGRPIAYKCTRLKLKAESEWIVVNQRFMTNLYSRGDGGNGGTQRWCLTHGKWLGNCRHCNDCSHRCAVPRQQCMKCYPGIACVACGLVPHRQDQANISEAYRGMCSTCYREATGNSTSETRQARFMMKEGIPFKSRDQKIFPWLNIRPDGEIVGDTSDISSEHDDEHGHRSYPDDQQHERTVQVNNCRSHDRGKVTIRVHPLSIHPESPEQDAQNEMLVKIVKHFMVADLGQRRFGGDGKQVIVFLGFSKTNKHYQYALKMKEEGYWDKVHLVGCRDS